MVKDFTDEVNLKDKGVYIIAHKDTDIKYVGSTTTNFQERWRAHLGGFKRGIGNRILLNIYNKYGIEGFRFSILEHMNNSSISEIRERERYWIEYYNTYNNGANCTLDTECSFRGHKGRTYTEEDKLKYMLTSPTKKKVYLYDINGTLLYIFPSSVACDRFLGLPKRRTNWAINHPIKSLNKKYYPSYEEKVWNPAEEIYKRKCEAMTKVAKARKENNTNIVSESQKVKTRLSNPNRRKVALYDLNDNFVKEFNSMNECDDWLNLYRGTTSKVFRGLTKVLRKKYIPKLI
jgi:hypothetical protein